MAFCFLLVKCFTFCFTNWQCFTWLSWKTKDVVLLCENKCCLWICIPICGTNNINAFWSWMILLSKVYGKITAIKPFFLYLFIECVFVLITSIMSSYICILGKRKGFVKCLVALLNCHFGNKKGKMLPFHLLMFCSYLRWFQKYYGDFCQQKPWFLHLLFVISDLAIRVL